jgi:putative nucleotidyltransferase with HDIG domain
MAPPEQIARPLAQQMLSEISAYGEDSGPGVAEARRVATRVGRGMLAERDPGTAEHSDDVVVIAEAICEVLEIRGSKREDLLAAARLHDIGKAAIPREILDKPGKLTSEEWGEIRAHTAIGAEIIGSVPGLDGVAKMIRHSHERWDGEGYPDRLAGEEIPLGSRVIFCADAFHAIQSDRPYRKGRPASEAIAEVKRNSGEQFDPDVVEALIKATPHAVRRRGTRPRG